METQLSGIPKVLQTFKRFISHWDGNQAADVYLKKRRFFWEAKSLAHTQATRCASAYVDMCLHVLSSLLESSHILFWHRRPSANLRLSVKCSILCLQHKVTGTTQGRGRDGWGGVSPRWARHQHTRHCSVFITHTHTHISLILHQGVGGVCLMSDRISAASWHILRYSSPDP